MQLTHAAQPLNVSAEARALAHMARQPGLAPTLTTADIHSFAANCLRRICQDADRLLAEAQANSGDQKASTLAWRISSLAEEAQHLHVLARLAARHDDAAVCAWIEADIRLTSSELIDQAHVARMLSIPRVPA